MIAESSIVPFMFGDCDRQLFGVLHKSESGQDCKRAVLVCSPFGREAIRVQRLQRVLAERLAREGFSVLRFDYYGAGDSHGRDVEVDLGGWCADILEADRTLRLKTGLERVIWVGFRLGATVMIDAVRQLQRAQPGLVLCEPVFDGESYIRELRCRHVIESENTFSLRRWALKKCIGDLSEDQALGYDFPRRFSEQLCKLGPVSWKSRVGIGPVRVLIDPKSADGKCLLAHTEFVPNEFQVVPLGHGVDWLSSTAQNVSVVPMEVLTALLTCVRGCP